MDDAVASVLTALAKAMKNPTRADTQPPNERNEPQQRHGESDIFRRGERSREEQEREAWRTDRGVPTELLEREVARRLQEERRREEERRDARNEERERNE